MVRWGAGGDQRRSAMPRDAGRLPPTRPSPRGRSHAGLGFENADEMARSNVDWHEAAALISAGATVEGVIRILL